MKLLKKNKGFTVVELVIVIGVIAVLSAILIPTFVNVTENAKKSAIQADCRTAYSEYILEAQDQVWDEETKYAGTKLHLAKSQDKVQLNRKGVDYVWNASTTKWEEGTLDGAGLVAYDLVGDVSETNSLTLASTFEGILVKYVA